MLPPAERTAPIAWCCCCGGNGALEECGCCAAVGSVGLASPDATAGSSFVNGLPMVATARSVASVVPETEVDAVVLLLASSASAIDGTAVDCCAGCGVPGADGDIGEAADDDGAAAATAAAAADAAAIFAASAVAVAAAAAATAAALAASAAAATSAMSSSIMVRPCACDWWNLRPLANLYFLPQSCSGHSSSTGEIGHGSTVILFFLAGICTLRPVSGLMRLFVSPVSLPHVTPTSPPVPLPLVPPPRADASSTVDLRFSARGGRNVVGDVLGVFETVLAPELEDEEFCAVLPVPAAVDEPPAVVVELLPDSEEPPAADVDAPVGVAGPVVVVRQARPLAPPLRSLLCTCGSGWGRVIE